MTRQDEQNETAILAEISTIAGRMSQTAKGRPTHLVFLALLALVELAIQMADDPAIHEGLSRQVHRTVGRGMAGEILARRVSDVVH